MAFFHIEARCSSPVPSTLHVRTLTSWLEFIVRGHTDKHMIYILSLGAKNQNNLCASPRYEDL